MSTHQEESCPMHLACKANIITKTVVRHIDGALDTDEARSAFLPIPLLRTASCMFLTVHVAQHPTIVHPLMYY